MNGLGQAAATQTAEQTTRTLLSHLANLPGASTAVRDLAAMPQ
jgi:hypothetical protein